jgi:hypothetical protein
MSLANNATAPAKLSAEDRQFLALSLRKQGGSYRQIAKALREQGKASPRYSEGAAYKDVIAALERQRTERAETVEQVRVLELERLDDLHAKLWPKAIGGDYMAFDRVVGLMGLRARLLGLYQNNNAVVAALQARESAAGDKTVTVQLAWGDGTDDWQMHAPADAPADDTGDGPGAAG